MSGAPARDKIRLKLKISGLQCPPEDITKLLELEPTRSSALRTQIRVPFWIKESPVDPVGSDPESQWQGLRPILAPLTAKLNSLSANAILTIELGVTAYDHHIGLFFPPDLVAFTAEINAGLDIDLYSLEDALENGN